MRIGVIAVLIGIGLIGNSFAGEQDAPTQQLDKAAPVNGTGFYIGGGLGGSLSPDANFSAPNVDPGFPASTQKKTSFGGLVELKTGYDWSIQPIDPRLTIGLEGDFDGGGQYLSAHAVSADAFVNGVGVKTGIADGVGIASLKIGYLVTPWLRPYIGAGGGGAVVSTVDPKINATTGSFKVAGATDFAPAYRGYVGADFFLNKNWAINTEYRYQVLSAVDFNKGKTNEIDFGNIKQHEVEIGVKYYFR